MTFRDAFTNWLVKVAGGPQHTSKCGRCGVIIHYGDLSGFPTHVCQSLTEQRVREIVHEEIRN